MDPSDRAMIAMVAKHTQLVCHALCPSFSEFHGGTGQTGSLSSMSDLQSLWITLSSSSPITPTDAAGQLLTSSPELIMPQNWQPGWQAPILCFCFIWWACCGIWLPQPLVMRWRCFMCLSKPHEASPPLEWWGGDVSCGLLKEKQCKDPWSIWDLHGPGTPPDRTVWPGLLFVFAVLTGLEVLVEIFGPAVRQHWSSLIAATNTFGERCTSLMFMLASRVFTYWLYSFWNTMGQPRDSRAVWLTSIPFTRALVELVDCPGFWQLIASHHMRQCGLCPWVLSMLESGRRLQFRTRPQQFSTINPTLVRQGRSSVPCDRGHDLSAEKGQHSCIQQWDTPQVDLLFGSKKGEQHRTNLALEGVQQLPKTSPPPHALFVTPSVIHTEWSLVHYSGPAQHILPHSNIQRPQEGLPLSCMMHSPPVWPVRLPSPSPLHHQGIHIRKYLDDWMTLLPDRTSSSAW